MRWSSRCRVGSWWALCIALGAAACDDSGDGSRDAALAACEVGDTLACDCTDGSEGLALCDAAGKLGRCDCELARTTPCSAPGRAFACMCDGTRLGEQLCLQDGRYTECACNAASQVDSEDAGSDSSAPTEPNSMTEGCPSGFSCVEQMGYQVCADDTTLPPLCAAQSDCAAAGLPDAACLDPGVGGVMLCVQACEL